ncbi:MAG TPA: M28 family metallopeptidase [Bryobacteraceae bacterium]|nr:M28 family metallopeptidase [Bryobacteraceae bacterium]
MDILIIFPQFVQKDRTLEYMHRASLSIIPALFILPFLLVFPLLQAADHKNFSGADAFAFTGQAVALGPRPDGSPAIAKLRSTIRQQLGLRGCELISDRFTAQTPDGPVPMENIIAKFPGKSGRAIAISGHYDTKRMSNFVGANDGGSSTGVLLELAEALQERPRVDDVYLVFFDGEEAIHEWTDKDSLYGSRHLVEKWTADGTIQKLKALINVDMTGDKNLHLIWDANSAPSVRKLVWDVADSLGYSAAFPRRGSAIDDDHMPFINAGVRAVDLIDFDSQNTFWHTPQDTLDKLDPHSFEVIGAVVMKSIEELEQQK